jgi:hypothetical protein
MFSSRRNHRPDSSIVALDVDRFTYVLACVPHRTPKPSPQLSARRQSVKVRTQLGLPAFLTYNFSSLHSRNCQAIPFLEMSARRQFHVRQLVHMSARRPLRLSGSLTGVLRLRFLRNQLPS